MFVPPRRIKADQGQGQAQPGAHGTGPTVWCSHTGHPATCHWPSRPSSGSDCHFHLTDRAMEAQGHLTCVIPRAPGLARSPSPSASPLLQEVVPKGASPSKMRPSHCFLSSYFKFFFFLGFSTLVVFHLSVYMFFVCLPQGQNQASWSFEAFPSGGGVL